MANFFNTSSIFLFVRDYITAPSSSIFHCCIHLLCTFVIGLHPFREHLHTQVVSKIFSGLNHFQPMVSHVMNFIRTDTILISFVIVIMIKHYKADNPCHRCTHDFFVLSLCLCSQNQNKCNQIIVINHYKDDNPCHRCTNDFFVLS